jgi:hypothetical protein
VVRFVITVTRGRWTRRMRVRSFVGAGVALPAVGAVPRLAGRPYLPSFPHSLSRETRDRLDPGSASGVTNDGQDAGPTNEIAWLLHPSQ